MVTITDYERIATVPVTQLGQLECPRCSGVCTWDFARKSYECSRCGRGWDKIPSLEEVRDKRIKNDLSDTEGIVVGEDKYCWLVLAEEKYVYWKKMYCSIL